MAYSAIATGVLGLLGAAAPVVAGYVGGDDGGPGTQQVPTGTPADNALRHYLQRLAALNVTNTSPSFADWVESGGKAKFEITDPGFTPTEAANLRLVDKQGRPIPFFQPGVDANADVGSGSEGFTPNQELFLGAAQYRKGADTALARMYEAGRNAEHWSLRAETAKSPKQARRFRNKALQAGYRYDRLRKKFDETKVHGTRDVGVIG